jgi:hypothetical protein
LLRYGCNAKRHQETDARRPSAQASTPLTAKSPDRRIIDYLSRQQEMKGGLARTIVLDVGDSNQEVLPAAVIDQQQPIGPNRSAPSSSRSVRLRLELSAT